MRFRSISLTAIALIAALCGHVAAEQSGDMLRKGLELRVDGRPEKAVEAFSAVLAEDPWNSEALVQMGASLEDLKRWDRAAEAYKKALEIDPDNWVALRNLQQLKAARDVRKPLPTPPGTKEDLMTSGLAAVEEGDYDRGARIFQLCRGLLPNDPKPLFYRAFCLERAGKNNESTELYNQIVESFPNYAPAWVNLIVSLLSSGDRDKAARRLRTALKILPNDRRIRSLERLTAKEERTVLSSRMGNGP